MRLFRAGSASPAEQLRQVREQAGTLLRDRVEPALADAAKASAHPFNRLLDLLPLVTEYGGPAIQALRRMKGHAEEAVAPVRHRVAKRHWYAPARPVLLAAVVLGVGYVAYRFGSSRGRPPAARAAAAAPGKRKTDLPIVLPSRADQAQTKEDCMTYSKRFLGSTAAVALFGLSGCAAYGRAARTDTSGVYPSQRDGTPANPSGTAATRAYDRAVGTDASGAYPAQRDGTPGNPPGTALGRAYDRVTGSDVSGAYPQNQRPAARSY